ncbi:unnamed protein product [Mycena citricolor]|uniref:Integrase catalytic domain-containing protein n=1 Tax=Mycena citricolor TaxID=2018698 RepID=A0AAD2JZI3_9AGAR|nr:unnamed protein product [Mycena citricolor]
MPSHHSAANAEGQLQNPTAAMSSPMATYVLAAQAPGNGTSQDSGDPGRPSNEPFRMGCGGTSPTVLNGESGRLCEPVVYAAMSSRMNQIPTFLDSGASEHCFVDRSKFVTYEEVVGAEGQTAIKSGGRFQIAGHGDVEIIVETEGKERHRIRLHALHTPEFRMNLISITTLDSRGLRGSWGGGVLSVMSQHGKVILTGRLTGGTDNGRRLYAVEVIEDMPYVAIAGRNRNQPTSLENWHRRLGHADVRTIKQMATKGAVEGLEITRSDVQGMCQDCILGKQDRAPFDDEVNHETYPLERVHLDLWGRARTLSWGQAVYLLLISDGGTSMKFPVFLPDKRKETVLKVFATWVIEAEVQTERRLKIVRVDLGSEFDNDAFTGFCQERGVIIERVPKASSSAHGHAERGNRTVIAGARTQLIEAGLDARFWAEATAAHCYVRGFIPSARHPDSVPWMRWYQKRRADGGTVRPNISHLRVWGSVCWVKDLDEQEGKLGRQGWEGRMVGYMGRRGYRVYDPRRMRVFEVRNVIFEEGDPHRTMGAESLQDGSGVLDTEKEQAATDGGVEMAESRADHRGSSAEGEGETRADDGAAEEGTIQQDVPPIPRRSARATKPSRRMLESTIAKRREEEARIADEDWARDTIRPSVNFLVQRRDDCHGREWRH